MKFALPFAEALALATFEKPLPPMIESVRCEDSTVHAEINLRDVHTSSVAIRFAFAAAGTVAVTARFAGYSDGVATFAVTAHARGLPAHKLLPYLLDPINTALTDAGLPAELMDVQRAEPDPLVLIDVQKAVASKTQGVILTTLDLRDEVISLEAQIGEFRLT